MMFGRTYQKVCFYVVLTLLYKLFWYKLLYKFYVASLLYSLLCVSAQTIYCYVSFFHSSN